MRLLTSAALVLALLVMGCHSTPTGNDPAETPSAETPSAETPSAETPSSETAQAGPMMVKIAFSGGG